MKVLVQKYIIHVDGVKYGPDSVLEMSETEYKRINRHSPGCLKKLENYDQAASVADETGDEDTVESETHDDVEDVKTSSKSSKKKSSSSDSPIGIASVDDTVK